MATITEVARDIYRVNIEVSGVPVTYSFFVIKDELPAMVETGLGRMFDESLEAVKRIIDPAKLRYILVPHFEGDECGALNQFLELAPHALPVCSPIGALTNLSDFAIREPVVAEEGKLLDLGQHRLGSLITPYVHQWDSMLAYEDTTRTVFSSDVFIQPGAGPATTDQDLTEQMLEVYRMIGIFPSRTHLNAALDKIEALKPKVLACHHGSVVSGKVPAYIRALRENDVTGLTDWNPMRERGY
jgi:flavorubredoxin